MNGKRVDIDTVYTITAAFPMLWVKVISKHIEGRIVNKMDRGFAKGISWGI